MLSYEHVLMCCYFSYSEYTFFFTQILLQPSKEVLKYTLWPGRPSQPDPEEGTLFVAFYMTKAFFEEATTQPIRDKILSVDPFLLWQSFLSYFWLFFTSPLRLRSPFAFRFIQMLYPFSLPVDSSARATKYSFWGG